MSDPRKTPKSKYTADRDIAGAFEGETVTRRRFMTLTAHGAGAVAAVGLRAARRSASRRARRSSSGPRCSGRRSASPRTSRTTPTSRRWSRRSRASARSARRRSTCAPATRTIDRPNPRCPRARRQFIAISTRCMHLGCPVRYVEASERFICPCHGGVYDFTGKVSGGPPVRPLDHFYVRVQDGQVAGRPALLGQLRVPPLPELPRPGPGARRHRPVHVPRPLLDPQAGLGRSHEAAQAPAPPLSRTRSSRARSAPATTSATGRSSRSRRPGISAVDWVDERTSLSGGLRWVDVPQGAQGHELVLHAGLGDDVRVPLPGRDRRLPGDVLPPRRRRRRLRVGAPHHQRGLPRRVRARHAQVGLDRDGDPGLPAHGAGRSSSAPTSTRAS